MSKVRVCIDALYEIGPDGTTTLLSGDESVVVIDDTPLSHDMVVVGLGAHFPMRLSLDKIESLGIVEVVHPQEIFRARRLHQAIEEITRNIPEPDILEPHREVEEEHPSWQRHSGHYHPRSRRTRLKPK